MANGFRITANKYVDKSGNDSNNGDNKNNPYKSLASVAINSPSPLYTAVGAGNYSVSFSSTQSVQLEGDGVVVIDLNDTLINASFGNEPAKAALKNLTLLNVGKLRGNTNTVNIIDNCILKGIKGHENRELRFINSKIINSDYSNAGIYSKNSLDRFFFSLLVNSQHKLANNDTGLIEFVNSYIDVNSTISLHSTFLPSDFKNNNIEGLIIIATNSYAIQDQLVGTPQDNGYPVGVNWLTEAQLTSDGYTGTIAGWDAAVATCINRDPRFNNVALEDFSLQADSPHIGRASDGGNIGGTDIANTVLVNQDGVGTIEINAQPEIDTTNPNFYTVATNEDEGYIDIIQRIGTQPIVLTEIEPISTLEFDSDIAGGNVGNQNVPDSEPQTAEYPRKLTTTSLASNDVTLEVTGHDVVVGEFVRVAGEDREVTAVTTNTITVGTAFRAAVASGVEFQAGNEVQLAALRPNRLTYQLRVSTQVAKPATDVEWDNNIDPIYNYEGLFSTQEWFDKPGYIIDGSNVYGSGDAEANPAITPDEIAATWINVRVWLRNNYSS